MRSRAAVLVVASLAAAAGTVSAAEAQVTGTLQASVTVVDDPVRRSLIRSVRKAFESGEPTERSLPAEGVAVRLQPLPAGAGRRRIRIEILY